MNWLKRIFSRHQIYSDLQEEMQEHVEERAAELTAAGMEPVEARRTARREFGNQTLLEQQGRDVWQWPALENLWRDLRFAVRRLSKVPGMTVVCVLTLALGLGATVALFSVVRAVLLEPLPFKDPGRLVMLYESSRKYPQFGFLSAAGGNFAEWQRVPQLRANGILGIWRFAQLFRPQRPTSRTATNKALYMESVFDVGGEACLRAALLDG